jgi:ribosomal protein S6
VLFADFITEKKGRIHRLNDWGMRSLAYDIKKAKRANYILMNIEIDSQNVNALNSLLEKDERVIRHMCMSQKAAVTEDTVPPEEYRNIVDGEEEDEEDEEWDEEEDGEEDDEEDEEEKVTELTFQRE